MILKQFLIIDLKTNWQLAKYSNLLCQGANLNFPVLMTDSGAFCVLSTGYYSS